MKLHKVFNVFILSAALLFGGGFVRAQPDSPFLKREVKLGDETYGYRVYVPKNRYPKKKTPVMLYLHNNGANGTDNETQIAGFDKFIAAAPKNFDFIIVFPQARPGSYWIGEQTEQAVKALDETIAEFGGDTQRLYLAGHSLGGYGTWMTAVVYPQKFAALVPVAGGIVPPFDVPAAAMQLFPKQIADILSAPNPYAALAEKIGDTPVWVFHGSEDTSISVKESRNIVAALEKNAGKNVSYTEYAKTDHNDALLKAFAEPELYKWLGKRKLKK